VQFPIPLQAQAVEGFANTTQARLWFWNTGSDGEAVILCHPASQSCRSWSYQQPILAAAGYRVIAYSRRGHYRSEIGAEDERGTSVSDLVNLMSWLRVDKAHLLGAAGGITAMGCAIAHPQRLRSLSLVGTIVAPDEPD
jgi:pimeloyl-ACP methyl ester carboxylesterase